MGGIVARRLDAVFFDTGILYRALAALSIERGVAPSDTVALAEIASTMTVQITRSHEPCTSDSLVVVNGVDITTKLRTVEVDRIVSQVSAHREVRDALRNVQREIGRSGTVVMVGRDIGTIVIPDAELKVFLLASPEERARRRYEQEAGSGTEMTLDDVYESVMKRDQQDSERDVAPLRPAEDSVIVDSDGRSIDEVADAIVTEALRRLDVESP